MESPLMPSEVKLTLVPASPTQSPPLYPPTRSATRARVRGEMPGGPDRRPRVRRVRRLHLAAPPALAPPVRVPVEQLPEINSASPEARAEMLRVVMGRFPDRSEWPDRCIQVIQTSTFAERAPFTGDDGGVEYKLLFWAIQEAESTVPVTARRWARFKTTSPSRLNIRPPPVVQLANIPREFLPPGESPPRGP
ncbi:hypothetical protein VPH35_140804 [Triticum aestivum]